MKIKYEFVNGDVIEVEAPDVIGKFIEESFEYSGVVEHLRRFKLNSVVGVN